MLLSTQTERIGSRLGDAEAVRILCEAGFDALDFSMFRFQSPDDWLYSDKYEERARELRRIADGCGVPFNQSHAPFPSLIEGNDEYNHVAFDRIVRAMQVSAILGAKIMVVHPFFLRDPAEKKHANFDFYRKLQPHCAEFGVRVALENMWGWDAVKEKIIPNVCSTGESFAEYLDMLDSRYFTACLDLGHCGLVGEKAAGMIRALGHDRLKALHVHDNDHRSDIHTAPYYGKMDWGSIIQALADIRYDGDFTFEADNFFAGIPDALLPDAAIYLQKIGRFFIRSIQDKQETRE